MTQLALGHCVFLWAHSLLSANLSCVQNGHVDNVTLHLWYIEVLKFSTCFQSFKNYTIDPYFQSHPGHYWHHSFDLEGFVAVGGFLSIINGPTSLNCALFQFKWLAKLLCFAHGCSFSGQADLWWMAMFGPWGNWLWQSNAEIPGKNMHHWPWCLFTKCIYTHAHMIITLFPRTFVAITDVKFIVQLTPIQESYCGSITSWSLFTSIS